jgi:transcription elongation factor GreB
VNKAFTKEDESDAPAIVPPRAPLPAGTPNYVTRRGLQKLQDESKELDRERARVDARAAGPERSRAFTLLAARKSALEERLAGAMFVDAASQPHDVIRFGARVGVRTETGDLRHYRIVGVDEAEPAMGLLAFVSPVARALLGRRVGETVTVRTPRGEDELEIVGIDYDEP